MGAAGDHFKKGNICRIYIKDFLTLDEVEIWPNPLLNFVCGPNGTGKSTVLCAICICLGGKPVVTGRGKEVSEFVKHGKKTAVLEVELFMGDQEQNVVVRRKFDRSNKSSWSLQGQDVTKKTVDKKLSELQIEMDNLCRFLPQDRVASFAKMNAKNLLEATEKAVGDPTLAQQHATLCTSGDRLQDLNARVKSLEDELSRAVKRNAQLKDAVTNHETKIKLDEDIKKLLTQRLWFIYDLKRKLYDQMKKTWDHNRKEMKALQKKLEPAVEKQLLLEKLEKDFKNIRRQMVEEMRKRQEMALKLQQRYECHDEKIGDLLRELDGKKQEEQRRQREMGDIQKQLSVLQAQLSNMPHIEESEAAQRLKELTLKIQKASQEMVTLQGQQEEAQMSKAAGGRKVTACERELQTIQDVKRQRLDLLKKRNNDAYKAAVWLQSNADQFSSKIHPPMCTLLNIRDPKYSKYVENRISGNDLVSFVCENKEDMNRFKLAMDHQRIRVNLVHSVPTPSDKYRPEVPLEDIRSKGFHTYMRETVDAPPAILAYLCRNYDIHRIPIADEGDYTNVPANFNNFYIGDRRYSKMRSRYDREVSTIIQPLYESDLLRITVDSERIECLKNGIQKALDCIAEAEKVMKGVAVENTSLTQKLEVWRNEKRVLMARKDERKVLEQRISQKKNQLVHYEAGCIDLEAEAARVDVNIKEQVEKMVLVYEERVKALFGWVDALTKYIKTGVKERAATAQALQSKQDNGKSMEQLNSLKTQVNEMGVELESLKSDAQSALQELLKSLGVRNYTEISSEVRERFRGSNLEETEKTLAEMEAHRDCLVTASDKEVEEYKRREAEMRLLRGRLETLQADTADHTTNLENVKQSWVPRITKLVDDISTKFSSFMAGVGCAGEVVLSVPEDPNVFTNYGISIRVSFRDHQPVRELTAHHQSGGERALSTALYLLTLQSLTPVPFRCVDEINQGMDPINERQMLRMLMETESNENASQYFFVTPKLLSDMEYTETGNTLFVYNSPTMVAHSRFSLKRILRAKQKIMAKPSL